MNNDQRIAEITARCEAATPGPWQYSPAGYLYHDPLEHLGFLGGSGEQAVSDATFIAHAREDIPYLLSQLAAKEAEIERLSQLAMMREGEIGDRDREIGLMTEAQRWRDAETEPPQCYGNYIVEFYTGVVSSAWFLTGGSWQVESEHYKSGITGVIGWMPLPAAPEEGE